ncbi:cysteine dioxygenase family protein [Falsiroseomonas tokyonensis]|uniref:NTP transferase domain-containing protein n=1 Tax=Falsiroseomonas tokyonensis TaxID=430521 RepID=A0ABV7BRV2_9PROT|nr:NTP transferase domain-containing protein [Falsiroseomonas tokyonensis]MBU8537761.1 cysteine dioxygenase family protein [Falsiroseomonas tokyonensis]
MTFIRTRSPRETMLAGIAAAARHPLAERPRAVAAAIEAFAADPALLEGMDCPCCPDRYIRHLLQSDEEAGYAVVALVWRPGQMSPVHGHKTWCAFAVHQGTLTETYYAAAEAEGDLPQPRSTQLLHPGQGSHGPADPALIHRLANLSCRTAISIHCYGVGFDRFGQDVNEVHAA